MLAIATFFEKQHEKAHIPVKTPASRDFEKAKTVLRKRAETLHSQFSHD
jgi:hypothetical protein